MKILAENKLMVSRKFLFGLGLSWAILVWLGSSTIIQGQVISYPVPPGIEASPDYQVRANNENIFVYKTPVLSFASFALSGDAEVSIDVHRPIKKVVVHPLARHIKPTVVGNTIRFRISKPCHLVVEVNGDLSSPLFLFANAVDRQTPQPGEPGVRYFEGGRVYEVGTLELTNHETVYLAGGAIVRGMIRAKNATGARIIGPGILDASTRADKAKMVALDDCTNIEINGPVLLGSYGWTIVPAFSDHIRLRNLKVLGWRDNDDGVDVVSSRYVTVDNCIFRTKDDCIAIKALLNTGKSTYAKDNFEPVTPPLNMVGPSESNVEDVQVVNSIFWSSPLGHALTVGFELRAENIRNISFENCDIIKKEKGYALSIDNADFGTVENVRFENIRVEDGCDKLLMLQVGFFKYSGDCPIEYARRNPNRKEDNGPDWRKLLSAKRPQPRGAIQHVLLKDIQIFGDHMPASTIQGWNSPENISRVTFENISLNGTAVKSAGEANLSLTNATGVKFSE